jgi:hypothetical protein
MSETPRYKAITAGRLWLVRDTATGETVFGSITRWPNEAEATARKHNRAWDRVLAEMPRPVVEPQKC